MKRKKIVIITSLILFCFFIISIPSPIKSKAIKPLQDYDKKFIFDDNDSLKQSSLFDLIGHTGPEDIAIDQKGNLYMGVSNGDILKILADNIKILVNTGGRPLGLKFDQNGNLIVCDSLKGLLSISPTGKINLLTNSADGVPFHFTNDVDIAENGIIYFTDASKKYGQYETPYDLLEAGGLGRLLSYNPQKKETKVLMDGLYFANGVAVSQDNSFVLVCETGMYRVTRYWIEGEKAGSSDIFIDDLPGFPDGISKSESNSFWLAITARRSKILDTIHAMPFVKDLIAKLPLEIWYQPQPDGIVLELDQHSKIISSLQDAGGKVIKGITSVVEEKGKLFFGNMEDHSFGCYRLGI